MTLLREDFRSMSDDAIWRFIERKITKICPKADEVVSAMRENTKARALCFQGILDESDAYLNADEWETTSDSSVIQCLKNEFRWSNRRTEEIALAIRNLLSSKTDDEAE